MISLDSIKIQVPTEAIKKIDYTKFKQIITETYNEITKKRDSRLIYKIDKTKYDKIDLLGISQITIFDDAEFFQLELSSKILRQDYSKLLTLNTKTAKLSGILMKT